MRELTLGAAAAAAVAPSPPPVDDAAASPVLLLVFDPELLLLLPLLRLPLLEVDAGVGGKFCTRSIVRKRCLQHGHLFSVSAH